MSGSFFDELKRRNVFRVALIYAVVSWLLMQIGDVMFPALRLPEWTTTLLVAFLILGLPIALIFAWAYEVTPDGVVRTEDVPPDQSITSATGQKINFMIIGVLAIAVVFLLAKNWIADDAELVPTTDAPEQSIAVLPFKNQSASTENAEFFAAGLHDELLTLLSRIGDLKVISRTSVEHLDPTLSIPEIGSLLGVATVLEGQVQRAGNRLRINVQLIDATVEDHLWANTYDSELTAENVFEVQGDIARTIANALQAELSADDEKILNAIGTENIEALDKYLLGVQIAKRNTYVALEEAREYLAEAVRLDPDYAEAWASLAGVYGDQLSTGAISAREYNEGAQYPVLRALELDPEMPAAQAQLGFLKWMAGDAIGAEASFREALRLNPNDSRSLEKYGLFLRSTGRAEEAVAVLEKALRISPLSTDILFQLGKAEMYSGRPERNLALGERILEVDPAGIHGYVAMVQSYVWMGRSDLAYPWYLKIFEVDQKDYESWAHFAVAIEEVGFSVLADRLFARAESLGPEEPAVLKCKALIMFLRGEVNSAREVATAAVDAGLGDRWGSDAVFLRLLRDQAFETGNLDEVLSSYRDFRPELFSDTPAIDALNIYIAADLVLLLRRAGQSDAAGRLLRTVIEWHDRNIPDGVYGFEYQIIKTELLALDGQLETALIELQRAVDSGWRIDWKWLIHGENLASLRNEPEFHSIVLQLEDDMATQLAAIRDLPHLGEYDLRDKPE